MMERLVLMYEKGAITADHLVVECLHMIDSANPALVLALLPKEILIRMLKYANDFRPNRMRTNYGLQPTADQVLAAKEWIEKEDSELITTLDSRRKS